MRFNDYQKEAKKTIPKGFRRKQMIDNGVYGLVGEFGEVVDLLKKARFQGHTLDKEKAILELGDILWYLAELSTGVSFNLYKYYKIHEKDISGACVVDEIAIINGFSGAMSCLIDDFYHYQNRNIDYEDISPIYDFLEVITSLCKKFDTTIEEVASKNIEKLRARYGEKFDPEKSINRSANDE